MLHKNHNPGFSFGFLKERPEYVKMVPLAVASFIGGGLAWMLPKKGNLADKIALSVTLGGAVSNLYDRLMRLAQPILIAVKIIVLVIGVPLANLLM